MDKNNVSNSNSQNVAHAFNENTYQGNDNLLESKIIFTYDLIIKDFNSTYTLQDLKNYIIANYSNQDLNYELLIDENPINNLPNDTLIPDLLNKYNTNIITLKSSKTSNDILNQLNHYQNYLTKNISLKENKINLINLEYRKLMEDLNSF